MHRPRHRLTGLLLILAACFTVKALMIAAAGPTDYQRRVDLLAETGTTLDRYAARLLAPDPISRAVALEMRALMR